MYKANAGSATGGVPPTDGASAAGGTTEQKKDEGVIDAEYVDVEPNK